LSRSTLLDYNARKADSPARRIVMFSLVLTIAVSVAVSFLCSLSEACLLSLSLTDVARLQEKQPMVARIWLGFKKNIDRPIAVILIVNTLANVIGAQLAGVQLEKIIGPEYIVLFTIAYSFLIVQVIEILPKTIGVRYNKRFARVIAVPLKGLITLFAPLVFVIQKLNLLFTGWKKPEEKLDAVGEISVLAHLAQSSAQITKRQENILKRALSLSKLTVKEVMVRKDDIKCLSTDMSLAEALIEAHLHHHTRFPLIEGGDREKVIGYVNFKDIVTALRIKPTDPSLRGIARPVVWLAGDETISVALGKLTSGYQHISLVRDGENRLIGMVTLENIIESIVGDVNDEYDVLPSHCYKLSETRTLAGGGIKLEQLAKLLDLPFEDGELTLNDWLLQKYGRVPSSDERLARDGYEFQPHKVSRGKVYEATIDKLPEEKKETTDNTDEDR
jgi:putative hemolysin